MSSTAGGICHLLKRHLLALVGLQLAKQQDDSCVISRMVQRHWGQMSEQLLRANAVQHLDEKDRRVVCWWGVISERNNIDHLGAKRYLSRAGTVASSRAVHTHHNKDGFLHRDFTSQVYDQTTHRCNTQTQRKRGKEITVKWACIFHNRQ